MTHIRSKQRGFSLVEVLVALIVVCVGMLGIAKMQAIAYSSTGNARTRSIAALQAASLAASMRANRTYWGMGGAPASQTIDSSWAVADTSCENPSSACSTSAVATYDLHQWATGVKQVLPGFSALIACPTGATPINCTVTLNWNENMVAMLQDTKTTSAQTSSYTLHVEP